MDTLLERFNFHFHFKWELGLWLVSFDCNDDEFCIFKKQIQKTHLSFICVMDNANVEQKLFTLFSSPWKILRQLLSSFSPTIKNGVFWVMARITKQRTSSTVTEPQEEKKGKLRKPTFGSTALVLLIFIGQT